MGVSGQGHAQAALYPRGKDPTVPIVQEAGWAPEPVWTQRIEGNILCPRRGSNPDRPVVQSVARHYTAWANPVVVVVVVVAVVAAVVNPIFWKILNAISCLLDIYLNDREPCGKSSNNVPRDTENG
jgi:hypothetical protein